MKRINNRPAVALALAAVLAVTTLPTTAWANASKVEHQAVVSADPANFTPNVLDGEVNALVEVDGLIIAGGLFTQVQEPGAGKPVLTRSNIMAFDASTGVVVPGFTPTFDGEIKALTLSADGRSVYVGGAFRTVNGQARDRLARIQVSDGSLTAGFADTSFNSRVNDLALRGDQLLVAGIFSYVNNSKRVAVASVDAATGELSTYLRADVVTTREGIPQVVKFDMTPDQATMFAIGNFTSIDGLPRSQIAKIDLGSESATVADWSTDFYTSVCSSSFYTYMRDLDISPDGSYMVVTTTGAYRAPPSSCDTWARFEVGSQGSGVKPSWVNYTGGDTTYAVEITGTAVYVGGHFRWANNPYAGDRVGVGAVERTAIAAVDPRSGMPYSWNPTRQRGVGVFDFLATTRGLWMGHDTDLVNGEYRRRVTFFPLGAGSTTPPPEKLGILPNDVYLVGRPTATGGDELRRVFYSGTTAPTNAALVEAGESWGQSRGSFLVDSSMYTGWSDGRLTKRSFDGQEFGAPSDVELYTNGFTADSRAFANDLPSVSGMFFDKRSGRLYYTRQGDARLLWRGFNTESDIVGPLYDGMPASFYPAMGDVGALDPANVRGMFLSGDRLYFADVADGRLWSVGFGANGVVGPRVLADASMDWRARGSFVWNGAPAPGPNVPPIAVIGTDCTGLTCEFTSSDSSDPDGSIASVSWSFGDGGESSQANPTHTFAEEGDYTVTLVVTDNRGADGTSQASVKVIRPENVNPVAAFTQSCSGLMCSFDGSGSDDPDGDGIVAYSWDFGDGASSDRARPEHEFEAAGEYQVALTVTDGRGGTGSVTKSVTVSDPVPSQIAFRDQATYSGNVITARVSVPESVQAGDGLFLFVSNASQLVPSSVSPGWDLIGERDTSRLRSQFFARTATESSAGSEVVVVLPSRAKVDLTLVAYSGTAPSPVGQWAAEVETVVTASHVAPELPVSTTSSWIMSYWVDRTSSGSGTWTAPEGAQTRATLSGTGGGKLSSLAVDYGAAVPEGTWPSKTAVAEIESRRAVMWTIELRSKQ